MTRPGRRYPAWTGTAVALVTGASSGIGLAIARRLSGAGMQVLASGRDTEALRRLAEATGATPLPADLATPGAASRLATQALAVAGRVDVLVNNAGAGWAGRLATMDPALLEHLLAVNLAAPMQLTRALLPTMSGAGHLVFVGSIAGQLGVRDEAGYSATKAGLDAFTASLRQELAGTGIGVSLIVPGAVDTPFFTRSGHRYARRVPRPVPPARIADATLTAIMENRAEVYVPGWLRLPVALRRLAPAAYRAMAQRFG